MSFRKDTLIIANWKMNPQTVEEAKKIASFSDEKGVVICPPFVFLKQVKDVVKKAELGAQNCFFEKKGAFTGEVSPVMLKNVGCRYVIVGHAERKKLFGENNKLIKEKIEAIVREGLVPILCVGETGKTANRTEQIKEQLLETVTDFSVKKIIIAYDPPFAISGTGSACSVEETEKKKVFIRSVLVKNYQRGESVPILYGGSVTSKNALSYIQKAGFCGVLVGGASLNKKEFEKIIKSVS